ncbi:TPMT family class I SAM-dependent methyltransferase [Parvicella tangerina]|uniref:Thiopurine S-methyltransferase n=1 Tax=Parvicella tangerina TaxID=2829795 RepID=A0A916NBG8_9FLAO|nr:TPMT family class I SAM-dependent methyltransferase [Parvicella tangerina]CAG5083144.1 Thiopurine S-methyltransferase [Parvicella tangerina]
MLDSTYWNNRYLSNETGWDIGHASPAIIEFFADKDKDAKILIPGCGNAYEGEVLHRQGFKNITLADFAEETKTNFLNRYEHFEPNQFHVGDFFELNGTFDYIVEQTFFCALAPSLREKYVFKMKELLHVEGKLVGLMFDAPMHIDHPPFGGSKEDYLALFGDHFGAVRIEKCQNSIPPRAGKELWIEIGHS